MGKKTENTPGHIHARLDLSCQVYALYFLAKIEKRILFFLTVFLFMANQKLILIMHFKGILSIKTCALGFYGDALEVSVVSKQAVLPPPQSSSIPETLIIFKKSVCVCVCKVCIGVT